jgi:hypothetical protein
LERLKRLDLRLRRRELLVYVELIYNDESTLQCVPRRLVLVLHQRNHCNFERLISSSLRLGRPNREVYHGFLDLCLHENAINNTNYCINHTASLRQRQFTERRHRKSRSLVPTPLQVNAFPGLCLDEFTTKLVSSFIATELS